MNNFGFHYTAAVKKREGIYRVRIYDIPRSEPQGLYPAGSMENHKFNKLQYVQPSPLPNVLLEIGEISTALDNEFLDGTVSFRALKLTFAACKELRDVVTAARDLNKEIWCEVTLEQWITDAEKVQYPQFIAPRKTRLVFWGKLVRNQLKGTVANQSFVTRYLNRFGMIRKHLAHKGTLEMSFMHWLKVRGNAPVSEILDPIRALVPPPPPGPPIPGVDIHLPLSQLLYRIVSFLNPTTLFACADNRLMQVDDLEDSEYGITHCNFVLRDKYQGGGLTARFLWELQIKIFVGGTPGYISALLDNSKNKSSFSLYNLKDVNELLVKLSEELGYKFQVELPTFDEIQKRSVPTNTLKARKQLWHANTARWIFLDIDDDFVDLGPRPLEGTIEYYPAAQWLKSITVEEPTADKCYPGPSVTWNNIYEGGADVTRKLLFRFEMKRWSWVGGLPTAIDAEIGIEIYIKPLLASGSSVVRTVTRDGYEFYNDWAAFHVYLIYNRWGTLRSTVEFESYRLEIEPFGSSQKIKPQRTFGFGDYGDFPMMRRFIGSFGLLYADDEAGDYSAFEISRPPGGNNKIRSVERKVYTDLDIPIEIPDPDPPDDPPEHFPPPTPSMTVPTNKQTVLGLVVINGSVSSPESVPVRRVEVLVGGVSVADAAILGSTFSYSLDSTYFINGEYTLAVRAYNYWGAYAESFITIKINN
jgi:hypothetical protein